jgi:N-acetylglucosamine-6-sulfatase
VPVGEADIVTAHIDLAPTILKLAGGDWKRDDLDGSPIPLDEKSIARERHTRQEHVNVEFWGRGIPEGIYQFSLDDGKIGREPLPQPMGSTTDTYGTTQWRMAATILIKL